MTHARPAESPLWSNRILGAAWLAVFGALPLVGLAAGPSYAPLLFGLAAILTLSRLAWPSIDRPLALLALLFLAVCAAGLPGAVQPAATAQRLGQMAAIMVGCLVLLAVPSPEQQTRDRLFRLMFWSIAAGALLLCADSLSDYRLQRLLTGGAANAATKYNRGLIALLLISWPVMAALAARGRKPRALILAALLLLALLVGLSSTGLAALLASAAIWLLAQWVPRATRWALPIITSLAALALPWLLRLASEFRPRLAPMIKPSGLHRLEIWDYMSARILERPWLGWGLGGAKWVPIRPEELAGYAYVSPDGIYPHNQWIELWL